MKKISVFLILLLLAFSACESRKHPTYIKDIITQEEGPDGLQVFTVLADTTGSTVSGNGSIRFIMEGFDEDGKYIEVYNKIFEVSKNDFQEHVLGKENDTYKVLSFSTPRLTYVNFTNRDKIRSKTMLISVEYSDNDSGHKLKSSKEFTFR